MSGHKSVGSPEKLIRGILDGSPVKAKQALLDTIAAYRDQHGNSPTIGDMQHLAKAFNSQVQKNALKYIHTNFSACLSEISSKPSSKSKP